MIEQIIRPRDEQLGAVTIRRILPAPERIMVGPFILMDQGGPMTVPNVPGAGVPEHPHAGLSTFTYLIRGAALHRDSAGNEARIRAGDIALMTAGSGITHEELPDPDDISATRELYFAQMWLALPDNWEEMAPSFEHHRASELPALSFNKATVKLLMGEGWGAVAPTTCHVETIFADLILEPGASLVLENDCEERALILLEGGAELDGVRIEKHDLHVLAPVGNPVLGTEKGCRALLFGGIKFQSPRFIVGSFVASSQRKIMSWMQDYAAGKFPKIAR